MYVSYRWLQRHIDLTDISPEQLCDDLTLSTAEVDGLERFAPHLDDVVVGLVTSREPHPDADKLSQCTVDVGADEPLTIVCGAPNVAANQKVAVATIGTVLPGDFKIKKSKIRGVKSSGMICSVRELDLGDEHEGIWVLPEDAEVGAPVSKATGIDDWVIEIDNKSLTHRPDLWGHRGIARELSAIYERPMIPLDTSLPPLGTGTPCPVSIQSGACSRYVALRMANVPSEASPSWLQQLLLAVGQRPIDLLIDLSNFVMLDLGQPNHVFDANRIGDSGIEVRTANAGETLQTLDEEERKLTEADLLICTGDAPVALAGIMGGEGSKVAADTAELLLEVATFDAAVVRRTSTRLGLRTDSSARFEKTLDPNLPFQAAGHFARLLAEICPGATFPAPITDVGDWTDPALTVYLRPERVRRALGTAIGDSEIRSILSRLGLAATGDAKRLEVRIPSFRASKDLTMEQDLIEEIGRIHRYGNIPEQPMQASISPPPPDPRRRMVRKIQDRLAGGARFHEAMSYSFITDDLLSKLGLSDGPFVSVINPVAVGEDKIRRNVLPSLLGGLEANRRHRDDVRLFEIGKGYRPEDANDRGEPAEVHLLGLVWMGVPTPKKAAFDANRFSQMQAVLEDLMHQLGLETPSWTSAGERPPWAHPTKCLFAKMGGDAAKTGLTPACVLAELEPEIVRGLGLSGDLRSEVIVAELSIDALLAAPQRDSDYRALPRYPGIKVDVAISVSEEMPAADLLELIGKAGKGQVVSTELFDIYRGDKLGAGRKSLAFHVLLQSDKKTLTDKDEQRFLKRFEGLVSEAGGELRKG